MFGGIYGIDIVNGWSKNSDPVIVGWLVDVLPPYSHPLPRGGEIARSSIE